MDGEELDRISHSHSAQDPFGHHYGFLSTQEVGQSLPKWGRNSRMITGDCITVLEGEAKCAASAPLSEDRLADFSWSWRNPSL